MDTHDSELEELRTIERELRDFLTYYETQVGAHHHHGRVNHPFAPRTVTLVEAIRPRLVKLEELREVKPRAA
jgi:hypothetical protein